MSEQGTGSGDRVEGMLRRWGAAEASGRTRVGPAPTWPPRVASAPQPAIAAAAPRASWLRWAPLAGAAAILLVTIAFLAGSRMGSPSAGGLAGPVDPAMSAGGHPDLPKGRGDLKGLQDDLRAAQEELAAEKQATRQAREDLQEAVDQLAAQRKKADGAIAETAELKTKNRQFADDLKAAQDDLAKRKRAAGQTDTQLAALQDKLTGAEKKLAATTGEIARAQGLHEAALGEANKLREELAQLKIAQAIAWSDFRDAYLATAAPGDTGFRALQIAVVRTQMLERCAGFQKSIRRESTRRVLDQLEAVLTRLTLIDSGNFDARGSFAALLRTRRITEEIDQALRAETTPGPLRGWLLEAKLIISGAERVG